MKKIVLLILHLILNYFFISFIIQVYLRSGALFWIVIFTFGLYLLLFLFPILSAFVPVTDSSKKMQTTFFILSFVTTLFWVYQLIADNPMYIYLDEGGSRTIPIDTFQKTVATISGWALLLLNATYFMMCKIKQRVKK